MIVIFRKVDAAVAAGLAGLVGGVVVGAPLEVDGGAGAEVDLDGIGGDGVVVESAREVREPVRRVSASAAAREKVLWPEM